MKNILNIDNGIPTLLSNVDDGTNTLYINDELVPSSEWTGTGYYTFTSGGLTFTIQKIRDDSGNIMLQLIEQSGGTSYRLIKAISNDEKYYSIDDPAETDLADGDYVPFYDTSAGRKKKSLWSNIVSKIWKPNTNAQEGYVASGSGQVYSAWKTNENGTPSWDIDAVILPTIEYSQLPSRSTDTPTFCREWLAYVAQNYTSKVSAGRSIIATIRPNSIGSVIGYIYSGTDVDPTTKLPRYSCFLYNPLNANEAPLKFGTENFVFNYSSVRRGIQNNLTSDSTTDSLSAAQGKALANGSARDSTKVAKAGDTMTGALTFSSANKDAIKYAGTKATYPMIKFIDNTADTYGNGIAIGGGGLTVVGSGEASDSLISGLGLTGGDESLYLAGDGDVAIFTNMQNGVNTAKTFAFGANGVLNVPNQLYVNYKDVLGGTAAATIKLLDYPNTLKYQATFSSGVFYIGDYILINVSIPLRGIAISTLAIIDISPDVVLISNIFIRHASVSDAHSEQTSGTQIYIRKANGNANLTWPAGTNDTDMLQVHIVAKRTRS